MTSSLLKCSVYLTPEAWDQVSREAASRGIRNAQLIRIAVDQFLNPSSTGRANHTRIAELCEFTQLVMDLVVKRDFPGYRDEILSVLDHRLGEFHV